MHTFMLNFRKLKINWKFLQQTWKLDMHTSLHNEFQKAILKKKTGFFAIKPENINNKILI